MKLTREAYQWLEAQISSMVALPPYSLDFANGQRQN